jgi:UPF0755 protein
VKEARKNVTKPKPGSTHAGRRMLSLLLVLAVLILIWLFLIYPFVLVKAPTTATIKVPRNATEQMVNDSLTKYFGDKYAGKVMKAVRLRHKDMSKRYGAYCIEKGTSAFGTMRKLSSGGQTPVKLTLTGFRTLPDIANYISAHFDFPADSVTTLMTDPQFLKTYGLEPENSLALLFEDTYEIYWTKTAREVIAKIADNYSCFWDKERTMQAAEMGLTAPETMILASIVDEETNQKSEKGIIGRLYVNRLNRGMPLQADPTVKYAVGDFTLKRILKEHLSTQSPYNTYINRGLPPGPIRTTSKETVRDILTSEKNEYLYMCADENFTGNHNFAKDYNTHMRNAMRYQKALNDRGIK